MAALSGGKTLAELSAQLGVHPTMISSRKQELVKTPRRDGLTGGEKNAALCQRAGPGEGSVAALSTGVSREFGTVEQDTAGPPQTPDRSAFGVGEAVVGPLPCIIQLLASRQWQSAPRLWIDIPRIHGIPSITAR